VYCQFKTAPPNLFFCLTKKCVKTDPVMLFQLQGETKLENLHHLKDLCLWSRMVLKLVKDKMWNGLQCIRIVSSVGFWYQRWWICRFYHQTVRLTPPLTMWRLLTTEARQVEASSRVRCNSIARLPSHCCTWRDWGKQRPESESVQNMREPGWDIL
jgi:hypothetical protein